MGNKYKGEIRVDVAGEPILLVLDHNALCELEDHLSGDIATIVNTLFDQANLGKISAKKLRAIIWAAMLHAKPGATLQEAGEVANTLGPKLIGTVGKLFMKNGLLDIPDEEPDDEGDAPTGNAESSKG